MESKEQPSSVAQVLQSLDVILVGVGTPFAVQTFVNDHSGTGLFLGLGYFLALINFFHAKFSLTLAEEFEAFSKQIGIFSNFVNLTLRIVLSGSFVFMAFYLASPAQFIVANLVMRSCDLAMDLIVLLRINRLNLTSRIRSDLLHVHRYWFVGTVVFTLYFIGSFIALCLGAMRPVTFGAIFFAMAFADTCFDYYWNRDFYFKPVRYVHVEQIVNNQSWQYQHGNHMFSHLPADIREQARSEFSDAVNEDGMGPTLSNAWCAVTGHTVIGAAITYTLSESHTVALKYLVVSDAKKWLQVVAYLARQVLVRRTNFSSASSDIIVFPEAVIVNLPFIERQAPADLRSSLPDTLSRLGFKRYANREEFWFLTNHHSNDLSVTKQEISASEWTG